MTSVDLEALRWFDGRTDPLVGLADTWPVVDWSTERLEIEAAYALGRRHHFLNHHPGLLPRLREWQVTKALKALLLVNPSRTVERCQALVFALAGSDAPLLKSVVRIIADDTTRMDLAVHCKGIDGSQLCIVLEVKLDAELSDNQLAKYHGEVVRHYPNKCQRYLWVVAPRETKRTRTILQRPENEEWRFKSWRALLIEWQRALRDDEAETEVLSLFSEIWSRTGGK